MKKFANRLAANIHKVAAAAAVAAMQTNAFALGGLDKATSTAKDIQTGIYTFVGVTSIIYLLYLFLMAKLEKKSWSDFGMGVVHVAIGGGSISLATWAWGLFA